MQSLKGKFVFFTSEDHWRTGQVTDVSDLGILVQFDNMNSGNTRFPLELVCLHEVMHATVMDGAKMWGFFSTREELDDYIEWLNGPNFCSPRSGCASR